jgi:hypothetical protein
MNPIQNSKLALLILAIALVTGCATTPWDKPPDIAGQPVPNQNIVLDFSKRYDLICRDSQTTRTYANCKILGYTGESVRDAQGIMSTVYGGHFGRWLVVELTDGRLGCLPPSSIMFLEEAKK